MKYSLNNPAVLCSTVLYVGAMIGPTLISKKGNYNKSNVADFTSGDHPTKAGKLNALENEFKNLSQNWIQEISSESSLDRITSNKNYLRVIALGKNVIPLILKELKTYPAPWFVALRALTGEDAVKPGQRGRFKEMANDWVEWGQKRGLV